MTWFLALLTAVAIVLPASRCTFMLQSHRRPRGARTPFSVEPARFQHRPPSASAPRSDQRAHRRGSTSTGDDVEAPRTYSRVYRWDPMNSAATATLGTAHQHQPRNPEAPTHTGCDCFWLRPLIPLPYPHGATSADRSPMLTAQTISAYGNAWSYSRQLPRWISIVSTTCEFLLAEPTSATGYS